MKAALVERNVTVQSYQGIIGLMLTDATFTGQVILESFHELVGTLKVDGLLKLTMQVHQRFEA